ncbi:MAG: carboxypeptidase regulatory-like domain-containing protein [Deltaproteobacteria bacterium]|nr:carboxypeptidase regulatory-like domain-containing protein [Deltaproteobacteria bacterium]
MIREKLFKIGLIFILAIGLGLTGCTSEDDDEPTGGSGGSGGTAEPSGGNGGGSNEFTGKVQDTVTGEPVPNIKVVALGNDDMASLGKETTTDADGKFSFSGIEDDFFCVMVMGDEGEAGRVDTTTCNIPSNQKDRFVVSTQFSITKAITGALYGEEPNDPSLASASGGVYWKNEAGAEFPVGCAKVEVEGAPEGADVWYFAGTLPDVKRTEEVGMTDAGGRFLVTRLQPGTVVLNAYVGDKKIGSTSLFLKAPKDSTGGQFNSNITRIYADEPGNPAPDCTE